MQIPYATVEQVSDSLEIMQSAYAKSLIFAKIGAATRSVEGFLHRRFYPEQRTILVDWPNYSSAPTWEIDLGDNELISVSQVLSGGTNITSDVILRRGDDKAEPPYSSIQVNLSSSSAFTSGTTFQQAISIAGLFSGDRDTSTSVAGAVLSGAINSGVTTLVLNPSSGYYTPGIGSLILLDTERILLIDRRMSAVSGQTTGGSIAALQATKTIAVTSGAAFADSETILIDAERMRIDDIAGNNLIVTRAWDGTALAAHTSGTAIYGLRTFVVQRGVLGSTAASHSDAASAYVHEYPPMVNELTIAESVVLLEQNANGYARTIGSGPNQREAASKGLEDVRDRCWRAHARKSRKAAV